jgi:hypothetical protein
MGSSQSTPRDPVISREKEIERNGVLIPPVFGLPNVQLPLSSSVRGRLPRGHPSMIEILRQTDTSVRILQDYMKTGVWIEANSPSGSLVHASVQPEKGTASGNIDVAFPIKGDHSVEISGGTDHAPTMKCNINWKNMIWLVAQTDVEGNSWCGVNAARRLIFFEAENKDHELHAQVGSWVTGAPTKTSTTTRIDPKSVNGYAVLDYLGATAAIEGIFPLQADTNQDKWYCDYGNARTRSYLSINLSDQTNDATPPLQLTLERSESATGQGMAESSIGLSQVFSLDRPHVNPIEHRAPKVRNTLGWAMRMERDSHANARVSLGLAWQVNRAVAVKAVVQPDNLTTALLLKRWEQPRILCSLLHRVHWKDDKKGYFGIGLEVETTPNRTSKAFYYPDKLNVFPVPSQQDVPETKATLDD